MDAGVRLTFLVDSPTWGGAETYVASLLRRLPDRFTCTLVATEPVPAPLAAAAEARGRLVEARLNKSVLGFNFLFTRDPLLLHR